MTNPPDTPKDDRRMHEGQTPGLDQHRGHERHEEPVDVPGGMGVIGGVQHDAGQEGGEDRGDS